MAGSETTPPTLGLVVRVVPDPDYCKLELQKLNCYKYYNSQVKMKNYLTIIILIIAAAYSPAVKAETIYVSGNVSGVWSADTVMVTGEITVPAGQTLEIQAGVKVLFQANCKFIVGNNAALIAAGAETDTIYFDAYTTVVNWKGIRFLSAANSSRLAYCRIQRGFASGGGEDGKGGAVYCSNCSPLIEHCLINDCSAASAGGAIYGYGSNLTIRNCAIRNNRTTGNFAHGGGIYVTNSNPVITGNIVKQNTCEGSYGDAGGVYYCGAATITGNLIMENVAGDAAGGGGISGGYSPASNISGNIILDNWVYFGGGIYLFDAANPTVRENIVSGNIATANGGGIYVNTSIPQIEGNVISGNSAVSAGAGIYCDGASPEITHNIVKGNWTTYTYGRGGGIECYGNSHPAISYNRISENVSANGGGISCFTNSNPIISNNTVAGNYSTASGGGLRCLNSSPTIVNSIIWGNGLSPISQSPGSNAQITYSDIQQAWPGMGNINVYPDFIDTVRLDYRLNWGSLCIDAGDSSAQYNDPDGSRADMGAYYYDQSSPVRILLIPGSTPMLTPPTGGTLEYIIRADNNDAMAHNFVLWCDVTLPDSSVYGPVLGPVEVTIAPGAILMRTRVQNVPASAPMGVYHYNIYALAGADTSRDSFLWGKLGVGSWGNGISDWDNSGESWEEAAEISSGDFPAFESGKEATLYPCFPNAFNPSTTITFSLTEKAMVNLRIYDIGGREAAVLAEGWREAGTHQVVFEAGNLSSGVYFAALKAGNKTQTQKMLLVK